MEASKRTTRHWVHGVCGVVALIVGVAGFFGWPRPFDPERWADSLVTAVIGLALVWQLAVPRSGWLSQTIGVALLIAAMVVYFADVPWPF